MELTPKFTASPTGGEVDFLTEQINAETPEYGAWYPFGFFIRDDEGAIRAGCNGCVIVGAIYTDQLWVHSDLRGRGVGRSLMEQVHAYGREQGCAMATVSTMDFQARGFYEKLGYALEFQRTGYAGGSSCLFLRKDLG